MKVIVFTLALISTFFTTAASAYLFEADLGSSSTSTDIEEDYMPDAELDVDLIDFDATLYFQDVSIEQGPWQEAAFLSKASGISIQYVDGDSEFKLNGSSNKSKSDIEGKGIAARGVFGSFVVEASFLKMETEGVVSNRSGAYVLSQADLDRLGVPLSDSAIFQNAINNDTNLQNFLIDNGFDLYSGATRSFKSESEDISLSLGGYVGDHQQWLVTGFFGEVEDSSEYAGIGGSYKNVLPLASSQYITFQGEINLLKVDSDFVEDLAQVELKLDVAFYPIKNLALMAGIESIAAVGDDSSYGDDAEYTSLTYSAGISYYPVEQLRISLDAYILDEERNDFGTYYDGDSEMDTRAVRLGIGMRF